jgi:DNA-binding transcriptional LysR family regulator
MLNNVDLSKLRIFKEVYLKLNIHRASEILQITPSAVSQSLKNLELDLGKQLFIRSKQRIVATELARDFYERIIPLYSGLRLELSDFVLNPSELMKTIKVGAPIHFGRDKLLPFIKQWSRKHDFSADMYFADSTTLLNKLKRAEIDLFFADKELSTTGVKRISILNDSLVFACTSKVLSKELTDIKLPMAYKDLVEMPHVVSENDALLKDSYFHYYKRKPQNLKNRLITSDTETLLKAVLAHFGVGLFYKSQIQNLLDRGTLINLVEGKRKFSKTLDLIYLDNLNLQDSHLSFITELENYL